MTSSRTLRAFWRGVERDNCEQIVRLAEKYPELITCLNAQGWNVFQVLAWKGDDKALEGLLAIFPNWEDEGERVLHLAASAGHEKVVAILLAHKPSPLSCMFFTPLHGAAKKGHEGVVAQLLVHTPNLTLVRCPRGYTPIHSAVRKRHEAVVARLLAHSPNSIDIPLDSDWTVLHTAVNVGSVALVALLLAHRPEMALARTHFGKLPLHGLMEYGGNKNEIAHLVLAVAPQLAGPISTDEKGNTLLHQVAALNCNVNVVAKVWRLNLQASQARNVDGQTPFHVAAKRKFGEVAELLQWQVPICDIVAVVKRGLPSFRLTLSKVCEPLLVGFTQDLRSIVFEYLGLAHEPRKRKHDEEEAAEEAP